MPAFTNALDPLTPLNTEALSNGDDRIRELKLALIERLSQVIIGFPDTNPLLLVQSAMYTKTDIDGVASGVSTTILTADAFNDQVWDVMAFLRGEAATKCARCTFVTCTGGSVPQYYVLNKVQGTGNIVDLTLVGTTLKVSQVDGAVRNIRVTTRRIA